MTDRKKRPAEKAIFSALFNNGGYITERGGALGHSLAKVVTTLRLFRGIVASLILS
jgi:hypothetical protein